MEKEMHEYLCHEEFQLDIDPLVLRRLVNASMDTANEDHYKVPSFQLLASNAPASWSPWVDVTRTKLAFGNKAIPRLKLLIGYKDELVVNQALCSLQDAVKNPEYAAEAIRLGIVTRLVKLLSSEFMFIRRRTLMVLKAIAFQPMGRRAIVTSRYIVPQLAEVIRDPDELVRKEALRTLKSIAENWLAFPELVKENFIKIVLTQITTRENTERDLVRLLEVLELLIDSSGEDGIYKSITYDACCLTCLLSYSNPHVRLKTARVIAAIMQHPIGKIGMENYGALSILMNEMNDRNELIGEAMCKALAFGTITTTGRKIVASNEAFVNKVFALIQLSNVGYSRKIFCVKIITNIAEIPEWRIKMRMDWLDIIKTLIKETKDALQRHLQILQSTIEWKP